MRKAIYKKNEETQNPNIIKHPDTKSIRLNKFIADAGYSSRRGADKLIDAGVVTINNLVPEMGTQVFPNDEVRVHGNLISHNNKLVYLLINKPTGITSTTDTNISGNIVDFIDFHEAIFPIGRLDKDSTGLLIMTNDGDLVNKILRSEYEHEKEYEVRLSEKIDDDFIKAMASGVKIYNLVANAYQVTDPCTVTKVNDYTFRIILKQGLNRQIRRMTQALGYDVHNLERIRIMDVKIGNLAKGQYRYLTNDELRDINNAINKFDY